MRYLYPPPQDPGVEMVDAEKQWGIEDAASDAPTKLAGMCC